MGKLECEVKKKTKKAFFKKAVLGSIGITGVISLAVLAPNALQMLRPFIKGRKNKSVFYGIDKTITRLKKQNLIYFENKRNGTFVRLTEKGRRYLFTHLDAPPKPKRWDEKWRILIFDIKEARKRTRNQLRRSLVNIGFVSLQKSVWVYPYDCEDLIVLIKADFKIGKDVLYIIADKIENDRQLKTYFNL